MTRAAFTPKSWSRIPKTSTLNQDPKRQAQSIPPGSRDTRPQAGIDVGCQGVTASQVSRFVPIFANRVPVYYLSRPSAHPGQYCPQAIRVHGQIGIPEVAMGSNLDDRLVVGD